MKILVLGASGMLGHRLFLGLDALGYDVVAGLRSDVINKAPFCQFAAFRDQRKVISGFDAFDYIGLRKWLEAIRPDVVLNCIGVIKQLDEGQSSVPCIAINALLPHVLNEILATWGGWLIHFSTDCVFKGHGGGYTEEDVSDASDWYGRTKYLGEVQGCHALTLRTSIIGRELRAHRSLVDWFLSQEGGVVKGYAKAIYSGITTREMVNVVDLLLSKNKMLRGVYHVGSKPISKYELLCLIRDKMGIDVEIERDDKTVILDRSLKAAKFYQATGYIAPSWPEMIKGLAEDGKLYLIIKMLQQDRHTGRDCRYPGYRDVS